MDTQGFSTRLFVRQADFLKIPSENRTHLSRQEDWSGLPFPSPGKSFQPRDWTHVSATAGEFFTTAPPRKPQTHKSFLFIPWHPYLLGLSPFVQHETEQNSETWAQNSAIKSFSSVHWKRMHLRAFCSHAGFSLLSIQGWLWPHSSPAAAPCQRVKCTCHSPYIWII